MSKFNTPHLQWPVRLDANSRHLGFVEQDSVAEIAQCVAVVYTARPGEFPDEPGLGLPEPAFQVNGVQESDLIDAANQWEPRASVDIVEDVLEGVEQTVEIGVESA